jgi:N-acetyl sugar amidotransferase
MNNGGEPGCKDASGVSSSVFGKRRPERKTSYRICSRCIMDTSDSGLHFDANGVCEYCQNFDQNIRPNWHGDEYGEKKLSAYVEEIKEAGRGKSFDCIIGLSGGLDSSYLAYIAKEKLGLRPLLFHVDAGWNTDQAVGNIEKLVDGLGLDLYTEVINWEEMKDLQVAFLKSQLAHQDIPQDTAFFATLYKFARTHGIKHVLTGGNYSTECCREPEEWGAYPGVDRTLILDVHARFGKVSLETFPIVDVFIYKVYYKYLLGMKIVKPLDLIPYVKKDAEEILSKKFGWEKFQHKHHESRFTRFLEDYWLPKKFGFDRRRAHFSSLIMTGQMQREQALERIKRPELDPIFLEQEFEYVANKLGLEVEELRAIFDGENKTCSHYRHKRWLIDLAGKVMIILGLEKRLYK